MHGPGRGGLVLIDAGGEELRQGVGQHHPAGVLIAPAPHQREPVCIQHGPRFEGVQGDARMKAPLPVLQLLHEPQRRQRQPPILQTLIRSEDQQLALLHGPAVADPHSQPGLLPREPGRGEC